MAFLAEANIWPTVLKLLCFVFSFIIIPHAADVLKRCHIGDSECIKKAATIALQELPEGMETFQMYFIFVDEDIWWLTKMIVV